MLQQKKKTLLRWNHKFNKAGSSEQTLVRVGLRQIQATNSLWVGTLCSEAWTQIHLCRGDVTSLAFFSALQLTAGELRCFIFHVRQPYLQSFFFSPVIFHRSLKFLLCARRGAQAGCHNNSSPIRPLGPLWSHVTEQWNLLLCVSAVRVFVSPLFKPL